MTHHIWGCSWIPHEAPVTSVLGTRARSTPGPGPAWSLDGAPPHSLCLWPGFLPAWQMETYLEVVWPFLLHREKSHRVTSFKDRRHRLWLTMGRMSENLQPSLQNLHSPPAVHCGQRPSAEPPATPPSVGRASGGDFLLQ